MERKDVLLKGSPKNCTLNVNKNNCIAMTRQKQNLEPFRFFYAQHGCELHFNKGPCTYRTQWR